jgi:hypothetical protein
MVTFFILISVKIPLLHGQERDLSVVHYLLAHTRHLAPFLVVKKEVIKAVCKKVRHIYLQI